MTTARTLLTSFVISLLWAATPAHAGHYRIVDVPDVVPTEHHRALASAGVLTTAQLYERTARRRNRRRLARDTGIKFATLTGWAIFVDLMQVKGIGPKMVRLLNASGIAGLKQLKRAKAASLLEAMRKSNRGFRYSRVLPTVDVVSGWIARARRKRARLQ
jgi:predicted flap endonuclease-1-like 5' DNA nuclease